MNRNQADDTMSTRIDRNTTIQQNPKGRQSLQLKLQDIKEVKKLGIPEEKFSYYDEYKTCELGVTKTIKPQFMYDAALARQKDREKEMRQKYEEIRNRFWKMWDTTSDKETQKREAKEKDNLHPYNVEIMKATNPKEIARLKETSVMYRNWLNRETLDAIVIASSIKPPTPRMKCLPQIIKDLRTTVRRADKQPNNLFNQRSDTSSVENVKEWMKHLNPYICVPKTRKRTSLALTSPKMSIPRVMLRTRLLGRRHQNKTRQNEVQETTKPKRKRRRSPPDEEKTIVAKSKTSEKLKCELEDHFSTISMEQLLSYAPRHQPAQHGEAPPKRRINVAKKTLELKEDIEMVKNLPVVISSPDNIESKVSCRIEPSHFDVNTVERWQEKRLYFQKQVGIAYDLNFYHPCLERSKYVAPKNKSRKKSNY